MRFRVPAFLAFLAAVLRSVGPSLTVIFADDDGDEFEFTGTVQSLPPMGLVGD